MTPSEAPDNKMLRVVTLAMCTSSEYTQFEKIDRAILQILWA